MVSLKAPVKLHLTNIYPKIWSRRKSFISVPRTDLVTKIALVLGDINVLDFIHKTV